MIKQKILKKLINMNSKLIYNEKYNNHIMILKM